MVIDDERLNLIKLFEDFEPFGFGDCIEGISKSYDFEEDFVEDWNNMFYKENQSNLSVEFVETCYVFYGEIDGETSFFGFLSKEHVLEKYPDSIFVNNYFCLTY